MRFRRVRLSNFKCYADADLTLDHGVTVIHGLNGSGKSSLLEACFFALYGARALDATLEDVITNGAEEASIELWFSHGGGDYRIERELKRRGDSAQTTTCVLETPNSTVEGARDVRAAVAEMLRMDASAFVNCAYVRQGEVNKLINASPGERQDMIDDLLQLGKLEEYRERASDARVGVGRVRDNKEGVLRELDDTLAEKESKDLHAQLNEYESELNDVADDIERFEENRDRARKTLEEAEATLEEFEENREKLDTVVEEVRELSDDIAAAESQREAKAEAIRSRTETVETLRERIAEKLAETELAAADADALPEADLEGHIERLREEKEALGERVREASVEVQKHTGDAENHRERASELDEQAEAKREEADDLEASIAEQREALAERRERIAELETDIEETKATFEDAPVDFGEAESFRETVETKLTAARETVTRLEQQVKSLEADIAEAEALLAEGNCPECGQPVEDSPHAHGLEEDRETLAEKQADLEAAREERDRLETRLERARTLVERESEVADLESKRDTAEQLVAERESGLERDAERVEELRTEAEDAEEQAAEARETATEAERRAQEARERIGELNGEKQAVSERLSRLETIDSLHGDLEEAESEIDRLRDERENIAEQNALRRERLADKRDRRKELEETLDEGRVETAKENKREAEAYLEKVEPKLEKLEERRSELAGNIGAVNRELEELEELRERRENVAETVSKLNSLYDEAYQLQEMYADLRAELRQQNVQKLERMLNETFELVYQNDSYSHIELDGEYHLTVYQKDGEPLDPEQLSGGERALFNLSLRCAIYRLLAEGIEGAAPMPPLILDEPTVFLDSGHVSKLVELVESMRELGVDQILVVSHDDELVGAADDLVTVEKDPTTNRSSAERAAAATL
ncbi:DNA double-strand break repair ATPase Rad50 [Natronomonas sp. EA1]|uniref:DNA double-strand break repair ATPase Rad50 n=1 Tax=Natronomonas sp. EA1 TaxID=3421655 RepID=UPI003EBBE9F7